VVVLPCWQQPPQEEHPSSSLVIRTAVRKRRLFRAPVAPGWFAALGNYPGGVSTTPSGAGDRLVRIGAIVFFIGALSTLVTVAPLFLGTSPLPSIAWSLCMLMGVGFLIAAAGVIRSARAGSAKR
jgi:hypothetical protein